MIASHPQFEERSPNVFQHEIAIITDSKVDPFPLVAVTNLDHTKTLHIGKREIIGFAKPKVNTVTYVATTNKINIAEYIDTSPRNWIPERKCKPLGVEGNSEELIFWALQTSSWPSNWAAPRQCKWNDVRALHKGICTLRQPEQQDLGSCPQLAYIAGDTLCHQPMGAGHVTPAPIPGLWQTFLN